MGTTLDYLAANAPLRPMDADWARCSCRDCAFFRVGRRSGTLRCVHGTYGPHRPHEVLVAMNAGVAVACPGYKNRHVNDPAWKTRVAPSIAVPPLGVRRVA